LDSKPNIAIVTGLSGGGKTVTLRTLEDIGYFCIDNLPPPALPDILRILKKYSNLSKIAVGIDIRSCQFFEKTVEIIEKIKKKYGAEVIFLEADDDTILRRYKETRRPHPLSCLYEDLNESIKQERILLNSIRNFADRIIDTSNLNPHELKFLITSVYGAEKRPPSINIISFGFKKGIPTSADIVFDARFLPNPYFVPSLTHLTGKDKEVKDFVLKHKETEDFLEHIKDLLKFAMEGYKKEGRAYITIAIGCTGGMHRSVVLAEEIANFLKNLSFNPKVIHRDL